MKINKNNLSSSYLPIGNNINTEQITKLKFGAKIYSWKKFKLLVMKKIY